MIYRGPGFLAVEWFGSSPHPPFPCLPSVKLDRQHTERLRKRRTYRRDTRGGGGGGAKSYDSEKASNTLWVDVYEYDEDEATVFPAVMIKKGRSGWGVLFPSIRYSKGICMQYIHIHDYSQINIVVRENILFVIHCKKS